LSLHHKAESGEWLEPAEMLVPDSLIIPTHPKVRLPLTKIENTCWLITKEVFHFFNAIHGVDPEMTFEINLIDLEAFRDRIINNKSIENRYEILAKNSPRFLWLATFFDEVGDAIFEIAFDATDIPQGEAIAQLVVINQVNFEYVKKAITNLKGKNNFPDESVDNFFPNFVRSLEPRLSEFDYYLNSKFGKPRAPVKLKPEEIQDDQLHPQTDEQRKIFFGRSHPTIVDAFPNIEVGEDGIIWAISLEGALLIGREIGDLGHPTLTGYKCARIAGELKRTQKGWAINSKSGRYSGDYPNRDELLENVKNRFLEIFYQEKNLTCLPYPKST